MKLFLNPFLQKGKASTFAQEKDQSSINFWTGERERSSLIARTIPKALMKINLIALLIGLGLSQVDASTYAQQVTLKRNKASLESVLKDLEKQSGYTFFYKREDISAIKGINIDVKNQPLSKTLNEVLDNGNFTFEYFDKTIVIKKRNELFPNLRLNQRVNIESQSLILNQQQVVRGKITDDTGKPIRGASVKLKSDPSKGVLTQADGTFQLPITALNEVLVISFVGFQEKEIKASLDQDKMVVSLVKKEAQVEEVVITTGIFKKADKSFTGASTTITAKELRDFGNRNIITSLRNVDPSFNIIESNAFGSNPNRLPEIQMRGNSNIPNVGQLQDQTRVGLNTPLIILDGFESSLQTLYDMNENEVESITLLKDAAATAIYGSRGSNGVVVITTKAPKAGKLRLSYRADINIEAPDLTDYSLLNARDKLDLEWKAGYYNNARAENDLPLKRYYNYLLDEVNRGVETDWMALPLRTGIGQRHNLRIEGGDQALRYSASAQVNNIAGVMKGSSRNTFNGNITLAYTYKNLRFRNNLQIIQGKSNESPYGTFSEYSRMNPYWRAYDENGNVIKLLGDPGNFDYTNYWTSLPVNPLYNASLNTFDKSETSELINNTSVEWNILNELTLRAQLGLVKSSIQYDKFRPADHTAFANYGVDDVFRKGDYAYSIENEFGYDGALNLAYSKMFNKYHLINGGFDLNVRQNQGSRYNFLAEGFPNANFDFISMALQYSKDGKPSGTEGLSRSIGFTSNVSYVYADRYFTDISLRIDGSSQFGANKKFAPFWSAGLGWNIHNEKFLVGNPYINRLKLRGSTGITGSQNFSAYQALSTYGYYTDQRYFNWMGAYLMGLGNEDLQWQQAMKYNVGLDGEFLTRRLKLTADYYIETTKDLVSTINLPASNGFSSYIENIGSMRNKGYEVKATGFILANPEKFTWSITAAVLNNKNKVLHTSKALKDAQNVILNGTSEPGILYIEGYSSNDIWVVPSIGIDPSTGKELFLGADGQPTYTWSARNIRSVGSTDPDLFGNFSTMVRYKSFSLNASFRYRFGAQQYNQTLVNKVELGSYKYNVDSRVYDDRWQYPGDIAAFKGLLVTTPTYKTSRFVQNENTLVCNNINFQYEIRSDEVLRKMKLQSLNFSANMAEPMYLSSIRRERGTSYPFSRQLSFTINATF